MKVQENSKIIWFMRQLGIKFIIKNNKLEKICWNSTKIPNKILPSEIKILQELQFWWNNKFYYKIKYNS
jgi:hypothetical protein